MRDETSRGRLFSLLFSQLVWFSYLTVSIAVSVVFLRSVTWCPCGYIQVWVLHLGSGKTIPSWWQEESLRHQGVGCYFSSCGGCSGWWGGVIGWAGWLRIFTDFKLKRLEVIDSVKLILFFFTFIRVKIILLNMNADKSWYLDKRLHTHSKQQLTYGRVLLIRAVNGVAPTPQAFSNYCCTSV